MKTTLITIICCTILFGITCQAQVTGEITGNLDQKVKIVTGDKALTNLGKSNGVVKGDIFSVYKASDKGYLNPLGKCAVVDVKDKSSTCEIIKIINSEIGNDVVVTDRLTAIDASLYPSIFELLTKTVDPYQIHREINVYIHSIVDEQNNITEFSRKLQKEVKNIFGQKKRIKLVELSPSKPLFAYVPSEYSGSRAVIEEYMTKENIDVVISGEYKVRENKIQLTFYKIDRIWEDLAVDTTIDALQYAETVKNVVLPYKPIKKETNLTCGIVYNPVYYKISGREDRNNIIGLESRNNPFIDYSMRRTEFNTISPVDFRIMVDKNEIKFDRAEEQLISMTTGTHQITATFKKGFYFNDSLLFTGEKEVTKNIVLVLDNPGNIMIEATANPIPGKEDIVFRIYKTTEKRTPDFKSVLLQKNGVQVVETFKD